MRTSFIEACMCHLTWISQPSAQVKFCACLIVSIGPGKYLLSDVSQSLHKPTLSSGEAIAISNSLIHHFQHYSVPIELSWMGKIMFNFKFITKKPRGKVFMGVLRSPLYQRIEQKQSHLWHDWASEIIFRLSMLFLYNLIAHGNDVTFIVKAYLFHHS